MRNRMTSKSPGPNESSPNDLAGESMSIEQMRAVLLNKYPGSQKIMQMKDAQLAATYQRLLNKGQL